MDNVVKMNQRMSEAEYDRARAELRNPKDARAKWGQQLAILFYRSGWTQQQLAEKESKTQQWADNHLRFGRFLNFTSAFSNPEIALSSLSERVFHLYWKRTEGGGQTYSGNERQRFTAVLKLMQKETVMRRPSRHNGVAKKITKGFGDGKWHKLETIIATVGATEREILSALSCFSNSAKRAGYGVSSFEKKLVGTSTAYRIFPATKTVSSVELAERLGPIVKELEAEGKKHPAAASPGTVAKLAHQLKQFLEQWTK
jgi:hypothetical protein